MPRRKVCRTIVQITDRQSIGQLQCKNLHARNMCNSVLARRSPTCARVAIWSSPGLKSVLVPPHSCCMHCKLSTTLPAARYSVLEERLWFFLLSAWEVHAC